MSWRKYRLAGQNQKLLFLKGSQWLPRLIKRVWDLTGVDKGKGSDTAEKERNKSLLQKMGEGKASTVILGLLA